MINDVCVDAHNWFDVIKNPRGDLYLPKAHGTFEIIGGAIQPLDFLQSGQYFRIIGSIFNDGVHQYPASNLTDEVFEGDVWAMGGADLQFALKLADIKSEINTLESEIAGEDGITAESFNGYSYSKATGDSNPKIAHLNKLQTEYQRGISKIRRPHV